MFIANHLSETQMTLGGLLGELAEAKTALEGAGARMATMLAMKGPSVITSYSIHYTKLYDAINTCSNGAIASVT